jgi:hypothetical protein
MEIRGPTAEPVETEGHHSSAEDNVPEPDRRRHSWALSKAS